MTTDPTARKTSGGMIPWMIVLFFCVLTVVFGGFATIAVKTHTGTVTDDAYQKGLAYNKTIDKAALQEKMSLSPLIQWRGDTLSFSVKDPSGRAVHVSNATLWLYRPAHAGTDLHMPMTRHAHEWQATPPLPAKGLWEARIHAETSLGPYQATQRFVIP